MLGHEMLILQRALIRSTETSLKGKNARDLKLSEQSHTRRCLFTPMHAEARLFEGEEVEKLAHDEGEYSRRMRSILKVVSVHEDVLPSGMTMQIAAHYDLPLPVKLPNHAFYMPVDWVKVL